MLKRSDFIVTNIFNIKDCSNIIDRDLMEYINTKYTLLYDTRRGIEHTIKNVSDNDKNHLNGFDVLFDIIEMK